MEQKIMLEQLKAGSDLKMFGFCPVEEKDVDAGRGIVIVFDFGEDEGAFGLGLCLHHVSRHALVPLRRRRDPRTVELQM